jgi:hypothetical protein
MNLTNTMLMKETHIKEYFLSFSTYVAFPRKQIQTHDGVRSQNNPWYRVTQAKILWC